MKRHFLPVIAMLLIATPLFAQAIPLKVSSPTPTPSAKDGAAQTFTGRIIRMDLKAGTFAVKAVGGKKTVELKTGDDIDLHQLRRGQRVVVTYSNGIATKVEATRSTQ